MKAVQALMITSVLINVTNFTSCIYMVVRKLWTLYVPVILYVMSGKTINKYLYLYTFAFSLMLRRQMLLNNKPENI